ncbi:hypothetical protein CONPUDRAFT_157181 [Coniophora puteana RWD-64-598 SS2]|uniref:DUF6533 domain-containing protein n=1 Tax=Coniophora puteana (strain RWD-64-598) TaxID=741705 RepID=A0A5M3MGW4_CONPW|nr:uncharacterized protein CONPUDRAFT_157181 [Coniophora puteana RWD-64-598 SS2]EIW78014.1 hypothetical protein CONPUDRAFT_157181 [Coniophora puteana RWD-64-598 SS2]
MSETIEDIVLQLQLMSYAETAALCLTAYDYLICLDQEVNSIWDKKFTLMKVFYLVGF